MEKVGRVGRGYVRWLFKTMGGLTYINEKRPTTLEVSQVLIKLDKNKGKLFFYEVI